MSFSLGGWKTYDTNLIDTSKLPKEMAQYSAGGKFKPASGGGKSGGGGDVMGSVASFAADLMEANATAKAGGARASGLARQGLNTMAQDKGMGLGKQRRLGYWLGG